MRGTSQASRDAVLKEFDSVATAAGKDGVTLAAQLFGAVDTLDASGSLRRALTDPARPAEDKSALVANLFASSDKRVIATLESFAAARGSDSDDLGDAIEDAGVAALLASADAAGKLGAVEEELFRAERTLDAEQALRVALDARTSTADARVALVDSVFAKHVSPVTLALIARAVAAPRGRRVAVALGQFLVATAERSGRRVADVTAAQEMSAAQLKRLSTILQAMYGREVQINVAIDPAVIGGIRIQVGDDVVDGTITARVDAARQKLVG